MRVAMLGLGLIGGSVARALAIAGGARPSIAAWSPRGDGPARARRDGTIDLAARTPEEAIDGADIVVLAAPATACIDMLDRLAGPWHPSLAADSVLTDVASTKGLIVDRARRHGLRFVGGHPMAGREMAGYEASSADLLVGRPWVIIPAEGDDEATDSVEALAALTGARPVRMPAAEHDSVVAAVSHLPLVLAASLVESVAGGAAGASPEWPAVAALAASGWRDSTRLARGDVAMGASIAATNAPALADRVRAVINVLEGWLTMLEQPAGPDELALADRLRAARDRLIEGDP